MAHAGVCVMASEVHVRLALARKQYHDSWSSRPTLARIIHERRRETAETEARRGFSQVRTTQAYLRYVEETEREKPRRARGSAAVVVVHE
jgi:hypothetical protein